MRRQTRHVLSVSAKRRVRTVQFAQTLLGNFTPFPALLASGFKYFHVVVSKNRTARGRKFRTPKYSCTNVLREIRRTRERAEAQSRSFVRSFAPVTGFDGTKGARGRRVIALFPKITNCLNCKFRLNGLSFLRRERVNIFSTRARRACFYCKFYGSKFSSE